MTNERFQITEEDRSLLTKYLQKYDRMGDFLDASRLEPWMFIWREGDEAYDFPNMTNKDIEEYLVFISLKR